MKKVCKFLYNEVLFISSRIVPCCSRYFENDENTEKYFIKANKDISTEVVEKYAQLRNKYIQMYKKGEIPEFCKNCTDYEEIDLKEDDDEQFNIKRLYVNNKSQCKCRCIYCCLAKNDDNDFEDFEGINKEITYDIKPILNLLKEKNYINSSSEIYVLGGEPTEHPDELNYIVRLCKEINCKLGLFSNCIIYNEDVADFIKTNNSEILCSLDCGTQKTYERVKRVKAFNRVVENLKKYSEAAKQNPNNFIRLKYIICPSYNDNIKEIKSFFKLANELEINNISLSMDRYWLHKNENKPIPKGVKDVVKYFYSKKQDNNLKLEVEYVMLPKYYIDKILNEDKKNVFHLILDKLFKIQAH